LFHYSPRATYKTLGIMDFNENFDVNDTPAIEAMGDIFDGSNVTAAKILQCAKRIVEERGSDNLKLATVARDAGLTVPAIYHHFPSRNALLDAVRADNLLHATAYFGQRQKQLYEAIQKNDRETYNAINADFSLNIANNEHLESWGQVAEILLSQKNSKFTEAVKQAISNSIRIDIHIVKEATKLGWIDGNVDPTGLVALALAYCIGLAVVRRIPSLQEDHAVIDQTAADIAGVYFSL